MEPERHPLNESFTWIAASGPFRRTTPEQVQAYNADGYFVLEDAFDAKTVSAVAAEIDPIEAQVEAFLASREGGRFFIGRAGEITFSPHLVVQSPLLRTFCSGPVFQDLAHDLIGPDVRLYWDQAVYKKPETAADFPWHQDNGYTFVEPQQYLTCWVALSDVSEANGCPWVVPGLHRRGTLRHWMTDLGWRCLDDPKTAVPTPARAGSIVVVSSLTPHRTGPNLTDRVRKAYIVQFAPHGARTIRVDEDTGARHEELCNDRSAQFPVLVGGRPA
jgi:phytanoyl-CoA hydroxylase